MTNERRPLHRDRIETPIGELAILVDEGGALRAVAFADRHAGMPERFARLTRDAAIVDTRDPFGLRTRFEAYFEGELDALDRIEVAFGGTAFQVAVWSELRRIPRGTTISYQELARRIGNVKAVRAVGLANGANPIGIVVPCHRVIGADRKLTGYAGGLDRKRWLLDHEGAPFAREREATGRASAQASLFV